MNQVQIHHMPCSTYTARAAAAKSSVRPLDCPVHCSVPTCSDPALCLNVIKPVLGSYKSVNDRPAVSAHAAIGLECGHACGAR